MALQTISQVSLFYGISTRTLRYWEQVGLIASIRGEREDYSYRTYDEDTVGRLRQIIVLRKLRIPLKQIAVILHSDSAAPAIAAFEENLAGVESELSALSTIRSILVRLLEQLKLDETRFALPDDETLLEMTDALTVSRNLRREETPEKPPATMEDLTRAEQKLNRLSDRDVRILYLPPMTVASYQYIGDAPEDRTGEVIDRFVREHDLPARYPAMRHFGFNAPNPVDETGFHGYERWVSIPEDMEVPAPLVKKSIPGGLYAAHMIPMGAFEEWRLLLEWVCESQKYDLNIEDLGGGYHMGLYEEHLNYVNYVNQADLKPEDIQLDLLVAVKPK